jgi:hypothetical protein
MIYGNALRESEDVPNRNTTKTPKIISCKNWRAALETERTTKRHNYGTWL